MQRPGRAVPVGPLPRRRPRAPRASPSTRRSGRRSATTGTADSGRRHGRCGTAGSSPPKPCPRCSGSPSAHAASTSAADAGTGPVSELRLRPHGQHQRQVQRVRGGGAGGREGDDMRRLLRWAFNVSAVVSALLFVGVCALWVRSSRVCDCLVRVAVYRYYIPHGYRDDEGFDFVYADRGWIHWSHAEDPSLGRAGRRTSWDPSTGFMSVQRREDWRHLRRGQAHGPSLARASARTSLGTTGRASAVAESLLRLRLLLAALPRLRPLAALGYPPPRV